MFISMIMKLRKISMVAIFPAVAKEYRAALIPFFLEGVGGRPELNQEDGIHPTARGYDIVVENVWKTLLPLLGQAGHRP